MFHVLVSSVSCSCQADLNSELSTISVSFSFPFSLDFPELSLSLSLFSLLVSHPHTHTSTHKYLDMSQKKMVVDTCSVNQGRFILPCQCVPWTKSLRYPRPPPLHSTHWLFLLNDLWTAGCLILQCRVSHLTSFSWRTSAGLLQLPDLDVFSLLLPSL